MSRTKTRYERVSTLVGYLPPDGFRVVSTRELEGGGYEVMLEPEGLLG